MMRVTDMKKFGDFLRRNSWLVIFTVLAVFITYATYLINAEDILTDMETYITHEADTIATFERVGRFGLFATKKIFSTDAFVPAVFLCYMMVVMCLTSLFCDFCIHEIVLPEHEEKAKLFSYVFNGFFVSCPVLVHQFYFYYQAFEVAFAFFLGILGAYACHIWAYKKGGNVWAVLGLGCMVWSFGTYQVLVPFYIAVNVLFYLVDYLYGEKRDDYFVICVKLAGVFLAGLAGYLAFSKFWALIRYHMVTSHLSDTYLGWGNFAFLDCLRYIKMDLWRVLFHQCAAFSKGYLPMTGLLAVLALWNGKKIGKKKFILYLLAVGVFVASPFFMTILLGNCQILRAHLVYPLVFAATAGLVAMLLADKKKVKYPIIAVLLFLFCEQVTVSNRYEQTVHFVADADREMARNIYAQAEELTVNFAGGGTHVRNYPGGEVCPAAS